MRNNVETDSLMINALGAQIKALQNYIIRHAKGHDPKKSSEAPSLFPAW